MEELLQQLLDKIFELEVKISYSRYTYREFIEDEFKELIKLAREIDIKKRRIK